MYPYIVCFCGRSIGDNYDLFKMMRHDVIAEAYETGDLDIDPSLLAISEQIDVDLDEVFNALGYSMDCCRVRLMSTVEFKEMC